MVDWNEGGRKRSLGTNNDQPSPAALELPIHFAERAGAMADGLLSSHLPRHYAHGWALTSYIWTQARIN